MRKRSIVLNQDHAPSTSKNYLTPEGYERLRQEMIHLMNEERPKITEVVSWAASNGDRSENADYMYAKQKLREIDKRLRKLQKSLENAEVVDSSIHFGRDRIFFGATVEYANAEQKIQSVTLVGMDEANIQEKRVSWKTPLGQALLGTSVGSVVEYDTPAGHQVVEVKKVSYPDPAMAPETTVRRV